MKIVDEEKNIIMQSGGSLFIANPPLVQSAVGPESERVLVSLDGAALVTENVYTANSASTSITTVAGTTTFMLQPPLGCIMDKRVLVKAQVILTQVTPLTGSTAANAPVPVSYPLNSAIETLTVKVNGQTLTSNPRYFKPIWERLYSPKKHQDYNSFTPTCRDNDYPIANMCAVVAGSGVPEGDAVRFGPFSNANLCDAFVDSRRQFPVIATAGAASSGTKATYKFEFTEPLLIDFFEMFDEIGLQNVRLIEININWAADAFSRMFSNQSSAANTIGCVVSWCCCSFYWILCSNYTTNLCMICNSKREH